MTAGDVADVMRYMHHSPSTLKMDVVYTRLIQ
jgi:hypothetical protein